jgi:hypothetical protein
MFAGKQDGLIATIHTCILLRFFVAFWAVHTQNVQLIFFYTDATYAHLKALR